MATRPLKRSPSRQEVLPWLLKKSTYTAFGSFGGSWQAIWFAKHWGFWRSIDAW